MANPQSIQIHCDGAMDYDPNQTGGNGFHIDFPDFFEIEPIHRSLRNDGQGIHRLEMISIVEAMEEIIAFLNKNPVLARQAAGVEMYTDRFSVTDGELINPYRIKEWRKAGWKNHEGKPIKNADLLEKIDKTRIKVIKAVGGSVTVSYKRRKYNKVADKLAKAGKISVTRGRRIIAMSNRRVIKRLYDGEEIEYQKISKDLRLKVRVYAWQPVGDEYEICFEICSGEFEGQIIKTSVLPAEKQGLQRGHFYLVNVDSVLKHHVKITVIEETVK
jgi:ribonuclease HI